MIIVLAIIEKTPYGVNLESQCDGWSCCYPHVIKSHMTLHSESRFLFHNGFQIIFVLYYSDSRSSSFT